MENHAPGGGKTIIAGDVSSFIDREVYLKGGYERGLIAAFLARVPKSKRGTVLDVGANIGTHSLCFAHHFARVHAFEPNPSLWPAFERNVALNGFRHVHLHRVGLADRDAELPFHLIEKQNFGLGTFSTANQYDLPLKEVGRAKVVIGDRYVSDHGIDAVDAVKIDVQGFEPDVLRGLRQTLVRYRPIIWCEVSSGTQAQIESASDLSRLLPEGYALFRFTSADRAFFKSVTLVPSEEGTFPHGDYLAVPCEATDR